MNETVDDRMPPRLREQIGTCAQADQSELTATWRLAALGRSAAPTPPVEAAWHALQQTVDQTEATASRRGKRPAVRQRARRRSVLGVGVLGAVLIGALLVAWLHPVTVVVPRGATMAITLPDGSTAELNSGTHLTYRRVFLGRRRAVTLEGEAFFDVEPGRRPFVVETFNAEVTVHGTRFNVKAWPDAQEATEVVLASGVVALASRAGEKPEITLAPGQMSRVVRRAAAPHAPVEVAVDRALAWRTGGLAFYNESLRAIAAEVARRFDVEIRLVGPDVAQDSLVLFLERPRGAGAVMEALRGLGYRCRALPDGYEITVPAGS